MHGRGTESTGAESTPQANDDAGPGKRHGPGTSVAMVSKGQGGMVVFWGGGKMEVAEKHTIVDRARWGEGGAGGGSAVCRFVTNGGGGGLPGEGSWSACIKYCVGQNYIRGGGGVRRRKYAQGAGSRRAVGVGHVGSTTVGWCDGPAEKRARRPVGSVVGPT